MIYDALTKGEDGLYHVKAYGDDRKKHFIQLNDVTIVEVGPEDLVFEVGPSEKIDAIHERNIQHAVENSQALFGKNLAEKTLRAAYTRDETLTAERIPETKAFLATKEPVELETLKAGDTCSVIVEFSGLWFAKKAFAPSWNIVQVRVQEPPAEKFDETYPDDYMFEE
jgi:hypothetical protein